MSSAGPRNPRPTRAAGVKSRQSREAQRRAAARRRNLAITVVASLMLLAAVAIVARDLTQGGAQAVSAPISANGRHAFITKSTANFVAGNPVDGVGCGPTEGQTEHIHMHLDVNIDGKIYTPPAYVGFILAKQCLYWIHMHKDYPGVIHVEAPVQDAFTLGDFLDIWSVTPDTVAGEPVEHSLLHTIESRQPSVVVVNGQPYGGDVRAIPLTAHALITLGYGVGSVTQQPFDFSLVDVSSMPATPTQ